MKRDCMKLSVSIKLLRSSFFSSLLTMLWKKVSTSSGWRIWLRLMFWYTPPDLFVESFWLPELAVLQLELPDNTV